MESPSLLLNLRLPRIDVAMVTATIDDVYAVEGILMPVGATLLDLTIDLSAASPHDCPPIGRYRLVLRDRAWLRRLMVAPGDEPNVGAHLGLFTTESDESLEAKPKRDVRVAVAGILPRLGWGE
jgi:hypothetical protein